MWILDNLFYYVIDKMVMCINVSSTIYLYCPGTSGYSSVGEIICQCSPACKNLVQELNHEMNDEMQKRKKKRK